MEKENTEKKPILGFTKKQILNSERYQSHRDALTALLNDDGKYTHKQVDDMLKDFFKKEVK